MMILAASSCRLFKTTNTARVSSPSPSPRVALTSFSLAIKASGRISRSVVYCASKERGMAEMVEEKKETTVEAAVASSSASETSELGHSRTFLDARTDQVRDNFEVLFLRIPGILESKRDARFDAFLSPLCNYLLEEWEAILNYCPANAAWLLENEDWGNDLLLGIRKEMEAGRLPLNVAQGMEELYQNYRNAVFQSGNPKAEELVLSNMAVLLDRIFMDVKDPFVFLPYHKAIREPFDYYMFVQNYIRPLIDFRGSYVGNISLFYEMEEKLQQGDNIVLMSNHQSEADPAVIPLLLETTNPNIAENLTYVAGDRVITDPLCKPFSMGRNLLCVYSKKHMNDVPELAEMKRKANTRSLKEMALLLREGSNIIWIAPSGGRDRPDPVTKEWYPAPFDSSSVDNMRRLTEHAGVPGHIYPFAILCYDIMPPPPQVEKEIGEKRVMSFHGTGISVAPNISFDEIAATCDNTEEAKVAYTQALFDSVNQQYTVLNSAIHGRKGLKASTPTVSLSQSWL